MKTIHWNIDLLSYVTHLSYGVMPRPDQAGHSLTQAQDLGLEPGLEDHQVQVCGALKILAIDINTDKLSSLFVINCQFIRTFLESLSASPVIISLDILKTVYTHGELTHLTNSYGRIVKAVIRVLFCFEYNSKQLRCPDD